MVGPLRHRQTKEAETDMFNLPPPRHISTLPTHDFAVQRLGGLRLCRYQFIPNKTPMEIDHVSFSRRGIGPGIDFGL